MCGYGSAIYVFHACYKWGTMHVLMCTPLFRILGSKLTATVLNSLGGSGLQVAGVIDSPPTIWHGTQRNDPGSGRHELGVSICIIGRWVSYDRAGEPLESSIDCGRKSSVSRVAKIVISKSMVKRGQSTRTLARKLTAMGHPVSRTTVQDYLTKSMHLKPFKQRLQPRLTRLPKRRRLAFTGAVQNWTTRDWR